MKDDSEQAVLKDRRERRCGNEKRREDKDDFSRGVEGVRLVEERA